MMEMQSNPRVMEAAMDIAMNGEEAAEKYATDEEVMALHQQKGSNWKRYFVTLKRGGDYINDRDAVLQIKDAEICVSNQWSLDSVLPFIEIMKTKGIRFE